MVSISASPLLCLCCDHTRATRRNTLCTLRRPHAPRTMRVERTPPRRDRAPANWNCRHTHHGLLWIVNSPQKRKDVLEDIRLAGERARERESERESEITVRHTIDSEIQRQRARGSDVALEPTAGERSSERADTHYDDFTDDYVVRDSQARR